MRRLANGFFASLLHDTNREEIYREIWLEPIQHVAKRYKLSDVGFAKVLRLVVSPVIFSQC